MYKLQIIIANYPRIQQLKEFVEAPKILNWLTFSNGQKIQSTQMDTIQTASSKFTITYKK